MDFGVKDYGIWTQILHDFVPRHRYQHQNAIKTPNI